MLNRQQLKEKLPHGYVKKVAERAGVSTQIVREYLKGRKNSERVEMATLEILAELGQKKRNLIAQIL